MLPPHIVLKASIDNSTIRPILLPHYKIVNNSETARFTYQCELGTLEEYRILSGLGLGAEIGDAIAIEKASWALVPIHDHIGNLTSLIEAKTSIPISHTHTIAPLAMKY